MSKKSSLTPVENGCFNRLRSGVEACALVAILAGIGGLLVIGSFGYLPAVPRWTIGLAFVFFWILGVVVAINRLQEYADVRSYAKSLPVEDLDALLGRKVFNEDVRSLLQEERDQREVVSEA